MEEVDVQYVGMPDTLIAAGVRDGAVVAFGWGFEDHGQILEQLSFILLDDGMLIAQPVSFPAAQRGWWYCDLISVTEVDAGFRIEDLYVDIIVGPPTQPYRVLDLDELAGAVTAGTVTPDLAIDGLRRCQSFLDRRLNRRHDITLRWPEFPPAATRVLQNQELPRKWRWIPTAAA